MSQTMTTVKPDTAPQADVPLPETLDRKTIITRVLPMEGRTFARLLSRGKFPKPDFKLSAKLQFWRRTTVLDWLAEQGE